MWIEFNKLHKFRPVKILHGFGMYSQHLLLACVHVYSVHIPIMYNICCRRTYVCVYCICILILVSYVCVCIMEELCTHNTYYVRMYSGTLI